MKDEVFSLPADFTLGTATASLQIEGGDTNNSWYRWSMKGGTVKDGTNSLVACDHWNRIDEDVSLMKKLRVNGYRMSLEWSRIEPEEGTFSATAFEHYREELVKLREAGIEPMVTLHHFSNPLWLEDDGGWTDPRVVGRFERYTEEAVRRLGDLVSRWATINEPNVYLHGGYLEGFWPPGERSVSSFFRGAVHMIGAHIAAYRTIHAVRSVLGHDGTAVGPVHHLRVFDPLADRPGERFACRLTDRFFQRLFTEGMATGRVLVPSSGRYPFGRGDFQDFFGVNYYTRDMVAFRPCKPGRMFAELSVREGAAVNDLGWEIYPEGLYRICRKYYEQYRKPVYITENGTCDAADAFRTRYVYDHLREVRRLIDDGIDVRGYYHWTLMDNFEWAEGESARFGLIETDYETQKRTIRPSGKFYADFCKNRGVTDAMLKRYFGVKQ